MLTYDLDRRGTIPRYDYLCRCIRDDILCGRLTAERGAPMLSWPRRDTSFPGKRAAISSPSWSPPCVPRPRPPSGPMLRPRGSPG